MSWQTFPALNTVPLSHVSLYLWSIFLSLLNMLLTLPPSFCPCLPHPCLPMYISVYLPTQTEPLWGAFPDPPSNHSYPNPQADRNVPSYCPMYRPHCSTSHWFDFLPVGLPPLWMVNLEVRNWFLFINDLPLHQELEILNQYFLKEWIQHLTNTSLCAQNYDKY